MNIVHKITSGSEELEFFPFTSLDSDLRKEIIVHLGTSCGKQLAEVYGVYSPTNDECTEEIWSSDDWVVNKETLDLDVKIGNVLYGIMEKGYICIKPNKLLTKFVPVITLQNASPIMFLVNKNDIVIGEK